MEIVTEIGTLQQELSRRFVRVQVLAQALHHRVRRAPPDDNTSIYITYSNAWMRFAGMANHGVLRTISASKVLRRLAPVQEKAAVPEPKPKDVQSPEQESSPVEDLISMYGEASEDQSGHASEDAQPVTEADA